MEYPNDFINKIIHGDCLKVIKEIPSQSIDLVVTDPPYGIDYRSNHGKKEYKERIHSHTWDISFDFTEYYNQCWRILKPDCFMYVFGRHENFSLMYDKLKADRILLWDKMHNGMGELTDWGIGYEFIYLFKKGSPKLRGKRINGIINFKHIGFFDKTVHPTQKPVGLIELIIKKSSDVDDIVFDPFLGSGTTAIACKKLDRKFIGIEIDKKYCDIAKKRIEKVPKRLDGFFS